MTFLLGRLDSFGGDRVISAFARGLRRAGDDVTLLSIATEGSRRYYGDLPSRSAGFSSFPRSKADYARAALRVRGELRSSDVVVATWTPTLGAAWLATRGWGRPRLVWLAMDYPLMFSGLRLETWLLRNGGRLADATIAISDACLVALRHPHNGRVIPIGVEDVFFNQRESPREGILWVGDAMPRKGLAEFLSAVEILRRSGMSGSVTIVSKSKPESIPAGIIVKSNLSEQELATEYRRAAVFVCTSHAEGWGLPALEAMASGTPVVTTSHGGCSYARHRENCLTVPVRDAAATAAAVKEILESPSLASHLTGAGRETAARFTWDLSTGEFVRSIHH